MQPTARFLSLAAVVLLWTKRILSFMPLTMCRRCPLILSSDRTNDEKPNDDDALQRFRKSLETSWDVKSMGIVPSDAESAAEAAAAALKNAVDKSVFFVNILVPQYDISSGGKYYDEVLTVEFCIALAQRLAEPSMICLRDSVVLNPVQRVLDAREKARNDDALLPEPSAPMSNSQSEDPFEDVVRTSTDPSDDEPIQNESADVKDFRAKLMADWSPNIDTAATTAGPPVEIDATTEPIKSYRLTSLLGDARAFSTNTPSLLNEIVEAVSKNALPKKNEGFIIFLAPSTKEEMIGIRALLQKYSGKKQFILVNCKFDPVPPELHDAETVYSVLPMIGKQTSGEDKNSAEPPKVVLLRRFPRDWELYVDIGHGFDLAATCGLDGLAGGNFINGPSKQWIQSSLESYLQKI